MPRLHLFALALTGFGLAWLLGAHAPAMTGTRANGDQLALSVAWVVALALSCWLGSVSGLGLLAAMRRRRLACAPHFVRRLVEVALVGSCVVGNAIPASATSSSSIATPGVVVRDMPVVRVLPITSAPAARTHVVRAGENLWDIAGGDVRYWHALVDSNRAHLRSGDPNLIYPGEVLTLPPA